jgi:hypothetical protein
MYAADDPVHPDIEDVLKKDIIDPGTSVAEDIKKQPAQVIQEDIVDEITGKKKKPGIPTWAWLLGGGVLAYFLFFRKK